MEFLTAIIPVILEPLVAPIKRHLSYAFRFRGKVNALRNEVKAMQGEIDVLQSFIGRGEVVETYVLEWQARAETAIAEAETVIRNGEEESQRVCSLRLKTRYQIGKQAADGIPGMVRLREERGKFGPTISHLPHLQQIVRPPVEGYEAQSRTELLNKVMAALLDPDVSMVGVHGVGGIGKTTLAKEVHRLALHKKLFDKVVIATVTATPELRRIHDEIAEFVIGSKLQENTDSARASRLYESLKYSSKDTRILIILDDLWDRLELDTVGIPTGPESQGCKILLTSRRMDLLLDMGSKSNFPVELLSDKESMSLFEKEVTDVLDRKIAEDILVKCGGFPLLIVTVAGLLRNKGLYAWNDALTQLSKVDNEEILGKVYYVLNLSYDRLPCEESKLIFLLCGICSRTNTTLLELLRYSLGLGLLKHYTVSCARNRLETLIDGLKACNLLDVDQQGKVKMHDVVRAMCIAHKDQRAFRHNDGTVLKEWPHEGDIGSCTRVSLPYNDIQHLPQDLGCPNIEFFLFFSNWHSVNIPDSTFQGTRQLKVIHFTGMEFASLPGSLHSLTSLHTLCLENCYLLDVAGIGQLKNLEILSFRRSKLEALPSEMGHLTRLKLLDLSYCSQLDFIPADVISKLTSLEELLMINSFDNWDVQESSNGQNARLSELKCLSKLASLEICVPNVQALPKDFFFNGLERYEILIGQGLQTSSRFKAAKTLKLKLNTGNNLLHKVRGLLEESQTLFLAEINGSTNLLYNLHSEGFPKLKKLWIRDSLELQQIVDCRKQGAIVCFPLLEYMKLERFTSLVKICQGRLVPESFSKLKKLKLYHCNKLKNLFSISMVRSLSQLEKIKVEWCDEMEAIFVEESDCGYEKCEVVEFPRLRRLSLSNLPQLKGFLYARESPSGSEKFMSFFSEKVALPNLEELQLSSIGNIKMIWGNQLPTSSFGKLNSLYIYGCHELHNVLPYDTVERLKNLKSLRVSRCNLLEEIYQFGEAVVGDSNNDPMIFGLNRLSLCGLPKLKCIWREDLTEEYLSFQNLESVVISSCESLKNLFPLVIAKSLLQLKTLDVEDNKRLEEIVAEEECSINFSCFLFPQLASLTLSRLPELRSFFPNSYTWRWPNLENVEILHCPNARIFGSFGDQEAFQRVVQPQVPNVQTFFSMEKVFPILEKMIIDDRILKSILDSQSWLTYLSRLKSLELSVKQTTLMEASQVGSFGSIPNLRDLVVRVTHSRIRQLWSYNKIGFDAVQPSIKKLELNDVSGLRHVWRRDSQVDPLLPYLESLSLTFCKNLIRLAPSPSASFWNLSALELWDCSKLTELMKPSTAKTMVNLVSLEIKFCGALKEIVATVEDGDQTTRQCIVFNKLKTIELHYLDNLEGFCTSSCYSFVLPCLEEVSIKQCLKMRIFCNGDIIAPKLQNIVSQGLRLWEGDFSSTVKQLHQVELQRISNLRLSTFPQLVERWGRELPFRRFSHLYELVVDKCPLFPVALPSNVLPALGRGLSRLVVEKCDSVEEILGLDGMDHNEFHASLMPRLSHLELIELPKLRHVWSIEDPLGISCFKNLTRLKVHKCGTWTHIFTLPAALGLVFLRRLEVKECALVNVIIKQQEDEKPPADWDHRDIFPLLEYVELENLPSLMRFYSGGDNMRCPALHRVSVVGCPRMCLLVSTGSSMEHDENVITHDGAVDEPTLRIFNEQVEILRLEELVVQWNSSLDKAWHEIVPPSFLCNLGFVQLINFPTVHQLLPLDFPEGMPKLSKFTIGDPFYEQRLGTFILNKMPAGSFAQLKCLELFNLPELKHLVEELTQLGSMFQHLKELQVSKCKGLTRLVTSSAARGLVNLEKLVVRECERMTEIVSSNEDEVRDEIVFWKLQSLEFDGLPCLESFSSEDYTFSFPCLEKVITIECRNMRTFSKNVPSTPMLDEVQTGEDYEDAWRWEGGLNGTIEQLFTDMNPTSNC